MKINNKKTPIAAIVPIYKDSLDPFEEFSFYHNAKILSKRDIYLVGPKRYKSYIVSLCKKIDNGRVKLVDDCYFDNSYKGNSRLMMNFEFYNFFRDYKYLLICHFDAFVFYDNLDYWISKDIDYVGAPLFKNQKDESLDLRYGNNGGLCLRKVDSCLKILSESGFFYSRLDSIWKMGLNLREKIRDLLIHGIVYNYNWKNFKPIIHEDFFWSICVPDRFKWFKVAGFEDSLNFSFEVKPRLLFEMNNQNYPFGIHGWWKYDKEYCLKLIFDFMPINDLDRNQLLKITKEEGQKNKIVNSNTTFQLNVS